MTRVFDVQVPGQEHRFHSQAKADHAVRLDFTFDILLADNHIEGSIMELVLLH